MGLVRESRAVEIVELPDAWDGSNERKVGFGRVLGDCNTEFKGKVTQQESIWGTLFLSPSQLIAEHQSNWDKLQCFRKPKCRRNGSECRLKIGSSMICTFGTFGRELHRLE